ncbi:MAG: hypothetical protein IJI68_14235 [Eggerthellaceae bacterium]|nr:hypothetical protein [Eggerthellaceae bacterium]
MGVGGEFTKLEQLASCYTSCLDLAASDGLRHLRRAFVALGRKCEYCSVRHPRCKSGF